MTNETLQLPQIQVDFHRPLPDICRVLLLGGRPPAIDWLHAALVTLPTPEIWAIDPPTSSSVMPTAPLQKIGHGAVALLPESRDIP